MLKEETNQKNKKNFRPYYDRKHKIWRVEFTDREAEEGSLLYVASEYARKGLYFPYHTSETKKRDYCGHSHGFEGVIEALLEDPEGFSIEGFGEYYSQQEREMLKAIQNRLASD